MLIFYSCYTHETSYELARDEKISSMNKINKINKRDGQK